MGVLSPAGSTVADFWKAIGEGTGGMRNISRFSTQDFPFTRAGEITNFVFPSSLGHPPKDTDLATQFMMAAAQEAVEDARLAELEETGIVLSTNFGGVYAAEEFVSYALGNRQEPAGVFPELSFQNGADKVADAWHFRGPRTVLSLSCSSGGAAIGYGADLIRAGRTKTVLTGGYDALSRFAWSGLSVLRTMSKEAVRPFDKNRDGTIFSEGAGALVLEELEQARERGAPIYAEVVGYGLNNNAFHMTAPAKEGAGSAAVMRMALQDGGLKPEDIDHINAHGTGTKPNDVTETQAIKTVFGDHARRMPITSIKSTLGHMMGAAGSVEAIASILSIRDGVVPPTTNFKTPDPECDLDYVTNTKRPARLRTVLSNSAGIGGCNAAVIFRKMEGGDL
jgi:3-oxoacyl-(acyl-carrier-protein) synthase